LSSNFISILNLIRLVQFGKEYTIPMRKILPIILLALLSLVSACQPISVSNVQSNGAVVQHNGQTPVPGSQFNKLFPKSEGDFELVYTQEKVGFVEAKLNKKGEEAATLAISDTATNPSAAEKYKTASKKIGGYPAVAVGDNGTAILVADRFQVQIRSKQDSFTASDRETWLTKFDLAGLAVLK
jgi:hypothetical protein